MKMSLINLHVNEISFSYEKMGTKTRFEEEAKGDSEMAYLQSCVRKILMDIISELENEIYPILVLD